MIGISTVCFRKTHADVQRGVHFPHLVLAHAAHILTQAGLVQSPDLLQQDGGVTEQATGRALEPYMGGLALALDVPRNGGGDDRGAAVFFKEHEGVFCPLAFYC